MHLTGPVLAEPTLPDCPRYDETRPDARAAHWRTRYLQKMNNNLLFQKTLLDFCATNTGNRRGQKNQAPARRDTKRRVIP
jgi:hypothetical protein